MRQLLFLQILLFLAIISISDSDGSPTRIGRFRRSHRLTRIHDHNIHDWEHFLDTSCVSEIPVKAPRIPHAIGPHYAKRKGQRFGAVYSVAKYECVHGRQLLNNHGAIFCSHGKWIGARPICIKKSTILGSKSRGHAYLQADDGDIITPPTISTYSPIPISISRPHKKNNENKNRSKCRKCQHHFEKCLIDNNGHVECLCKDGFERINGVCQDINECKSNACQHYCTNLVGSFQCHCKSGYRLLPDGNLCEDINECLLRNGHGPCEDTCTNTLGSYKCSCLQNGTRLSSDGHTCDDDNECNLGTSGCSHGCINTRGKAYCSCPDGMILGEDWKTCYDKPQNDRTPDEYYDENEGEDEYIDGEEGDDYGDEEDGGRDYEEEENEDVDYKENRRGEEHIEEEENEEDDSGTNTDEVNKEDVEDKEENSKQITTEEMNTTPLPTVVSTKVEIKKEEDEYDDENEENLNNISSPTKAENTTSNKEETIQETNIHTPDLEKADEDEEIHEVILNKTHTWTVGGENSIEKEHEISTTEKFEEEENIKKEISKHDEENSNKIYDKDEYDDENEDKDEDEIENDLTIHKLDNQETTQTPEVNANNNNNQGEFYEKDEYDEEDNLEEQKKIEEEEENQTTHQIAPTQIPIIPESTSVTVLTITTEPIIYNSTTTTTEAEPEVHNKSEIAITNAETEDGEKSKKENEDDHEDAEEEEDNYEYTYEDEYEDLNEVVPLHVITTPRTTSTTTTPTTTPSTTAIVMTKLCNTGFKLNENFDCVDINECEDPENGCSDYCENTVGSYKCTCPEGYQITDHDKYTCQDIDECMLNKCSHNCFNTPGSFKCECPEGWILMQNTTCKEITCSHGYNITNDMESGYICLCPTGYILNENGTCIDIDECTQNICEQICINREGSYECSCRSGYISIGNDCDDIDECLHNNGGCLQLCANTNGGFECGCQNGYYLDSDNKTCLMIDLCREENGGCSDICNMENGKVLCSCYHGRELFNSTSCKKINPCEIDNGGCSHVCIYEGELGVKCDCPEDHILLIDARTCEEINPCFENNGGCSDLCTANGSIPICSCSDDSYILQDKTCFKKNLCLIANGGCSHICDFEENEVRCSCPPNHKLFGKVCEKRNPCEEDNGGCSHFCNFINEEIVCECPSDYELVEKTCEQIDPCRINNGGCSHECISDDFEVECHCPINYELEEDYKTCKAIDPCYNNGGCSHICRVQWGRAICHCASGYVLDGIKECKRVDPCEINNGNCSHHCSNIFGDVECSCPNDLVLINDTKCVNPCSIKNGGCSHECTNVNGKAVCQCPFGYILEEKKTCVQKNPCLESNGGCSHICLNIEGQAICRCPNNDNFELIQGKICKQIDPCLIQNGGCSHSCTFSNGKVQCLCPQGYNLKGNICEEERNICLVDNGGCSHICSMRNGLKYCSCPTGYVLSPNQQTCKDFNECLIRNGGCSQICRNRPGSYKCTCKKGFRLSSDNHTCVGIRGCGKDNGGCEHSCQDLLVGYKCTCREGFELRDDNRTCAESSFFECTVKIPKFGRVKCTAGGDVVAVGTQCLYNCDKGYKLIGEALRTCEYSGEWDVGEPICAPASTCPKLTQPLKGKIIPHSCNTAKTTIGQTCMVHCRSGHKLIDPRLKYFTCGTDLQWNVTIEEEKMRHACVPHEIPKPFIRCPGGGTLSFTLPEGARTMQVRISRPDSNVDWWRFVHSEPKWGKELTTVLPPGRFEVQFTATSPAAQNITTSCKLVIHVKDEEPPKKFNCPHSKEVRLDRSEYSKKVYWSEPHFEDNIGVRIVYKTKEPGSEFPYGLHHINYIASDYAGNRAYCHFSINVVNYYQHEASSRVMTRYRSVLICPHGIQYMSRAPDHYDNTITSENGCKWTYIRMRDSMGQPGYRITASNQASGYQRSTNLIRDIPYTTPTSIPTRRHYSRQRFHW